MDDLFAIEFPRITDHLLLRCRRSVTLVRQCPAELIGMKKGPRS